MTDPLPSASLDSIQTGQAVLGIEMGSTRIKAVLIGPDHAPLASGGHAWENQLVNGIWTYPLEAVWSGLQACMADLHSEVTRLTGAPLRKVKAFGVSGMMHGYLPFDQEGTLLAPFRTWRNNITGAASAELTQLFQYPIPQRWSVAHLYQAILNGEEHTSAISHLTTLAGYVHWKLTGKKIMGIGEASGMFPIDSVKGGFHAGMLETFDQHFEGKGGSWKLAEILPDVRSAGEHAGDLTAEGASLLDPEGHLQAGTPMCPPEGDAGTGMVATNSVEVRTGNVSAGTSVFAMLVLEHDLSRLHTELDMVTTPDGHPVAMAHSNNCTSDIDAWIRLFGEAAEALGASVSPDDLYGTLYAKALEGEVDGGGLLSYGYLSGEHVTGFEEGRPLFARSPHASFTLANFMRTHLMSALCALRTGLNILLEEEQVEVDEIRGHGGFFKTPGVGTRIMAAATGVPVSVLETAGEGGAWGIALLAAFSVRPQEETLPSFLKEVFGEDRSEATVATEEEKDGFQAFFKRYHQGLTIEQAAVNSLS